MVLTLKQSTFWREGVYTAIWKDHEMIKVNVQCAVLLPYSERVKNMMEVKVKSYDTRVAVG